MKRTTAITAAIRIRVSWLQVLQSGDQDHPLYRRQDADGGGDYPVPQQEGNADIGQEADEGYLSSRFQQSGQDLLEDDGAPFPLAAEAHGQPGVLGGDQDGSWSRRPGRVYPCTLSGVGLVRAKITVRV